MGPLHAQIPFFDGLGELGPCTGRQLGYQPLGALLSVRLYPALYRVVAHTELLAQHRGVVSLLQVQTHYLQPKLVRIGWVLRLALPDLPLPFAFFLMGYTPFY
jgi:hypothetical protein